MVNQELMINNNHNISFTQEEEHYMETPHDDYTFPLEPLHDNTNIQIDESEFLQEKHEIDEENQTESYDNTFDLSYPDNDYSETSDNDKLALIVTDDLNDNLQLGINHCMSQQQLALPPIVQSRSLVPSDEHDLVIGREFSDVLACRRALRDAAIALHFEMQTVKSDKSRFTAKCATEGCPWRIHCAKLPGVPTFTIRTIHGNHTCDGILHLGHQQASVQWVAEKVTERLKENPNCKPKEILEEIHQVHGITLSYKQAWRGKERIMASVRGSFEDDYRLLPRYCDEIRTSNPGSIAVVNGSPVDGSFQQLFISFHASISGFNNSCRPLIALDRTVLKTKYLGTLLIATGFDGDGGVFPLAFAVIGEDNNNDNSWQWFLSELRQLLEVSTENMPKLTIISSREKPIVDSIDANFPTAFHGFCIHHLVESLRNELNTSLLVDLFWEAANCLTEYDFNLKIQEISQMSPEAELRIRHIPPSLWTTYNFAGTRFGQLNGNVIELLSGWIQDCSGLPIIQMVECLRRHLMTLFNERREMSKEWSGMLVPSAERRVLEAIEESHGYVANRVDDSQVEVLTEESMYIVDIKCRSCYCRGWELNGLPCSHAVAALLLCQQNVYRYTESCFNVVTYRQTYAETIHPIPDKTMWKRSEEEDEFVIRPPRSLRIQPRPRKRRSQSEGGGRQKRVVRCSRCNQAGHFRTTCTAPI